LNKGKYNKGIYYTVLNTLFALTTSAGLDCYTTLESVSWLNTIHKLIMKLIFRAAWLGFFLNSYVALSVFYKAIEVATFRFSSPFDEQLGSVSWTSDI